MITKPKEPSINYELDMTNIELSDVIDAPAVQELMNAYFAFNGLAFAIIDMKGEVLVAGGWQDICVKFHRSHPESCKFCHESDISNSSGVAPGAFKTYRCKNNMWDIATPIMLGERHVGNIFIGQLIFDDEEVDYELFRAQARRFGYDEAAYIAALDRVPRCSREVVNAAMSFCSKLAQMISTSNYNKLLLADSLDKKELTEEALRKSEAIHSKMVTNIGDVIVIIDRNGINRYKSPNVEKCFGWKPEELVGFSAWANVHPDDLVAAQKFVGTLMDKPGSSGTTECRYRCKDGNYKWIEITLVNLLDDPDILGILGNYQDITDRKRIEEVQSYLLQISTVNPGEDFFETLARYLAKTLGMGYVCIDTLHGDGLTARTLAIYHDGKFEDNVEYALKDTPCGDVVGKEVCVFPRDVCSLFPHDAALQELQAESYLGTTLWSFDMKPIGLIAVIGQKELLDSRFAESVLKLVSIRAAGELERRQAHQEKHLLEQQFQQTQKLESLGVLAGGIAHDFNNILAIIVGYCGLTRMDYEDAEKHIPEIEKAAERAAALCRQMLSYAGKASLTQNQVNTWMLMDEMVVMLKTTIQQNVLIKTELGTDVPFIMGDASQLRQVVMNLIINAAEAIGEMEGEINIKLAKAEIKAERPEQDHLGFIIPAGRYICFEVSDNGCGMDHETMRKIFEPFYTTKFPGRGLGMSAVLGIIKAHNGALQLESRLGHGTTFRVYLPVQLSKSEAEEAQQIAASAAWQGSGTVLLVEDEVQVKTIAIAMLQKLGFTVLDAANGKEALELYQQNANDITMVVTDMGMPVMNGYELFYRLKQLDPKLPIIISSGFGEVDIASKIPRDHSAGMINKPYRFDQLREVLKEVVNCDYTG